MVIQPPNKPLVATAGDFTLKYLYQPPGTATFQPSAEIAIYALWALSKYWDTLKVETDGNTVTSVSMMSFRGLATYTVKNKVYVNCTRSFFRTIHAIQEGEVVVCLPSSGAIEIPSYYSAEDKAYCLALLNSSTERAIDYENDCRRHEVMLRKEMHFELMYG